MTPQRRLFLLYEHAEQWSDCDRCELATRSHSRILGMPNKNYSGEPIKFLVVTDGYGFMEDILGKTVTGASAKALADLLDPFRSSYYITSPTACRACDHINGVNRHPTELELETCAPRIRLLIELLEPKGLLLMGTQAVAADQLFVYSGDLPSLILPTVSELVSLRSQPKEWKKIRALLLKFTRKVCPLRPVPLWKTLNKEKL